MTTEELANKVLHVQLLCLVEP